LDVHSACAASLKVFRDCLLSGCRGRSTIFGRGANSNQKSLGWRSDAPPDVKHAGTKRAGGIPQNKNRC